MAKQNYSTELIEAVKNLMEWQVKHVQAFDNWAYNDAHRLLAKIAKSAHKPKPKQEPYAYIDDKNRLVKISGHVYFDGGFVDANREIPDSWKTLLLVEKVGG